jgi:predicted NACHT family NTPase
VKSQQPADRFVQLIKQAVDQSISRESTLQKILVWVLERSESIQANYKPAAIRAYYFALDIDFDRALDRALNFDLDCTFAQDRNPKLANQLKQLRAVIPISFSDDRAFRQWWQANGTQWLEELRQVMIQHRNIGHDWQLTDQQKQQLQRYYDTNRFLVDLIKIEGAVTDSVRAEIEDSLLLPWEELQKRSRQGS